MNKEPIGSITVNVPATDRLVAITALARMGEHLACALMVGTQVTVSNCTITTEGTGIAIDTVDGEATSTETFEIENEH